MSESGKSIGGTEQMVLECLQSNEPLDQGEIVAKTGLTESEVRKSVGLLVDKGDATTTLDWRYTNTEIEQHE